MRTLAYAALLRDAGAEVVFAVRRFAGDFRDAIDAAGFAIADLGAGSLDRFGWLGVPFDEEVGAMRDVLARVRPHAVIVDHYELDARWETVVRATGVRVIAIDDLADRPHVADVVIDTTPPDVARYAPHVAAHTRLLLGPRYALVRPGFLRLRERQRPRDGRVERILVFYSGVDAGGETEKALRALRTLDGPSAIDVVIGPASPRRAQVVAEIARDPRARLRSGGDDMAGLCETADLALGAPGSASWERCFAGLPTLATAIAPNQFDVLDRLAACGAVVSAGRCDDVDEARLAAHARALLSDPRCVRDVGAAAAALTDGWREARRELAEVVMTW